MTCEDCAQRKDAESAMLEEIRMSQLQSQAKLDWMVTTVEALMKGFQDMMSAGGPLAMLKMMRSGGKNG
jgi:hypothetical protein